ncbi:hypothetical protein NMG60_11025600 [Bertholletia excelsa]
MSTLSFQRMKDRGGGGGRVAAAKPSKTLTPVSEKLAGGGEFLKRSAGKENSTRATSRGRASSVVAQKPAIRPMPRIDKSSADSGGDPSRARWSTLSAPRGRSSSPSDFNRMLADLRRVRVSKVSGGENERSVSTGRKGVNGVRIYERCQQKNGVSREVVEKSSERRENRTLRCSSVSRKAEVGIDKNGHITKKYESDSKEGQEPRPKVSEECRGKVNLQQKNVASREQEGKSNERREYGALKGNRFSRNTEVGIEKSSGIPKKCESDCKEGEKSRSRVLEEFRSDIALSSVSSKSELDLSSKEVLDDSKVHEESKGSCIAAKSVLGEKSESCVDSAMKELSRKSVNTSRCSESLKLKDPVEEGLGGRAINKYPSKLHEKLAFLEGKVKRIASDIKRTKEMLDRNNPDTSKVILSDIQEKISGIEKAMGHVVSGAGAKIDVHSGAAGKIDLPSGAGQKMSASKSTEDDGMQSKSLVESKGSKVGQVTVSVNGLNNEDLEARLFPHHKLLRDRTSLKTQLTSQNSQNHKTSQAEPISGLKSEEKLLSPTDENLIAMEFLASLNKDQQKDKVKDENVGLEFSEVQETDDAIPSSTQDALNIANRKDDMDIILTADETLDEFVDQENKAEMISEDEIEDSCINQLNEIGRKTSTAGWFVSEGEAVLLAHSDGSCSFYDIANCEEKAEYRPPLGVSPNVWRDCWIIRAPGADGCSGRYVVAASAGNTLDSGFCSWDFYTKDVRAFHSEDATTNSREVLAPLPNNTLYRRNTLSTIMAPENQQWWYKPCGPLIVSTASCQRAVRIYDIRDGESVMKWEVQRPVLAMDHSSPLQWRNRGKVVVTEAESISLWDVSSLTSQALVSVSLSGRKVSALHINNTDAELGGGVRQRVSSSEAEGNDGVFCTSDAINILDFRQPSGVGLKIPKLGLSVQSVFSRGDSIFVGCINARPSGRKQPCSQVQQFSLRKQKLVSTYSFPETNAHANCTAITQVWGNSNFVMAVCGLGLFVFDALKDDGLQPFVSDYSNMQKVREIIGPDDLYSPSFDYLSSRVLLISRDRPALWRYLS